jgi:hypothetical protein
MPKSLAEPSRARQSARNLQETAPTPCEQVYHFAQPGWRAENPGYLKSEAAAQPSELFP